MNRNNKRVTTCALLMASVLPSALPPAQAVLPVIDAGNLSQNVVTAMENVAQTLKQIEQYRTQLQQYENMIQNTAAPPRYLWDQASTTMTRLRTSVDTLSYYKSQLGSIDAYLSRFKNTADYRNSPCFTSAGCTPAQWSALAESQRLGSESQKRANDALFKGLDQQQDAMVADARQLQNLQSVAQTANGQVQAIGYANQLASHQATQLLQIRALLIAQQNAVATRDQALADREAQQAASDQQVLKNTYRPSPVRSW